MKKIIIFTAISMFLFSCSDNEKNKNIDTLISSKNLILIKEKRELLQADIAKLDEAIAVLDTKKQEALVTVQTVKDTVFTHYVEIQGNIDTKENLIIYPQFAGVLTSLNAVAGQKVSKGQVLGRIDDGGLSQQVAQLETQLALAKTTFERQKRLWDQKIGSEIQYLQAQTNMISQQKAVSQIKAQLAKTVIVAPFSGVIDQILIDQGQVIAPGQGLMRIVNLSNMYVSTTVPETYINKLNVGAKVDVYVTSLGKNYIGKIRQVGNYINPSNRSFDIQVAVPNSESLLRPNQVAKLKIVDYVNPSVMVIPSDVIQQDAEGSQFVFIADNPVKNEATAKKVIIKTGKTGNNVTEIVSGLKSGDVIVTEGANTISEGMKLNF